MRSLLILLAVGWLCVCVAACGNTDKGDSAATISSKQASIVGGAANTTSATESAGGFVKEDGDRDNDDDPHGNSHAENDDVALLASYGGEVDEADKQTVTGLVKDYYMAAVAGDGVKACSLLAPSLAQGISEERGRSGHSTKDNCAAAVSLLFKQQHGQLVADEVATMGVTDVRAKNGLGLAVLGFKRMPEGVVLIARVGDAWKIDSLLDSEMT